MKERVGRVLRFLMSWGVALGVALSAVTGVIFGVVLGEREAQAVSVRWEYETAYWGSSGGDWYRDSNNETATLAWGESYVMMSLAAMFRATGDVEYLHRLSYHIDGVLASRDDARGVTDYRGVSGACWQNTHYQSGGEAYCYVVHSGMLGWPMVELARLVEQEGLQNEVTWDGGTLGAKATAYVTAAQEVVAFHDDQWDAAGYYVFRPDATFLSYPGTDLPFNQSNAMGRMLLALYDVTGQAAYLDKATALAQRFADGITVGASGEALWNYWGGAYSAPGEDVSHAAINLGFALECARRGVVFGAVDRERFAQTFMERVYIDDVTFSDHVGGGDTNGYNAQLGRWAGLTPTRTGVYAAVLDLFRRDYPPSSVSSGSVLAGWGALAEFEPRRCEHFFYSVDWDDPDPQNDGDWREATAYGANILTTPPDLGQGGLIPLQVDVPRAVTVEQWDGDEYFRVASWAPTGGPAIRHVPYEPRWPFVYWNAGVLFQFADSFVSGDGILVKESEGHELPNITSSPPGSGFVGVAMMYTPAASGEAPLWWSLSQRPTGAQVEADTGVVIFTPSAAGDFDFTLQVENDWGLHQQSFVYTAVDPGDPDGGVAWDGAGLEDGGGKRWGGQRWGGVGWRGQRRRRSRWRWRERGRFRGGRRRRGHRGVRVSGAGRWKAWKSGDEWFGRGAGACVVGVAGGVGLERQKEKQSV